MIDGTLQYLLLKLSEDCTELSTAASKAALFDIEAYDGERSYKNNLEQSFNDVYSSLLLINRVMDNLIFPDEVSIVNKLERLSLCATLSAGYGGIYLDVANNVQECVTMFSNELKERM